MTGIHAPLYASAGLPRNVLLDSNLRFLGGAFTALAIVGAPIMLLWQTRIAQIAP